ncbi:MAG: nuclear transport factor 2 family protein [Chitinophagaceae bacterium]|jgi:hypothetical protein|nr:nuclear transport factor 2 family protein [Chitinophagaceae bacterium]OQY97017.1 MAG: hypothetical protein B6D37_00525 [Sphingobacteriales bacterium UTBCD1]
MELNPGKKPVVVPGSREDEVSSAVDKFHSALIEVNDKLLEELLCKELSYGHSNGLVEDKRSFITKIKNRNSAFTSIKISRQKIIVTGETAVVRHHFLAGTNDKNLPGKVELFILQVWQWQNRRWKLLARQALRS